ncbi:hypothetical protein [Enterococcus sp. AZ196]|uniref:hypothetical protein n=1 Tax=Enterococcus sp. AZ196 TaxID=2774659 RepID=UPI003D279EE7
MPKRYTKEFKEVILELHKQGKSARQLSLEYEVGYSIILKWVQGTTRISPGGLTPDEAKALKKQLKEKDEELLILKKSTRPAGKEIEIIEFIRQESEAVHHSVSKMWRLLGISRAVYYRKINLILSKRANEQALLDR